MLGKIKKKTVIYISQETKEGFLSTDAKVAPILFPRLLLHLLHGLLLHRATSNRSCNSASKSDPSQPQMLSSFRAAWGSVEATQRSIQPPFLDATRPLK